MKYKGKVKKTKSTVKKKKQKKRDKGKWMRKIMKRKIGRENEEGK